MARASTNRVPPPLPLLLLLLVSGSSPPSPSGIGSYFVPRSTPQTQPSLEATGWNKEAHEKEEIACADFGI